MNPFELQPKPIEDTLLNWQTLYPTPYNKLTADPYTKIRIILMNGIEVEATMFSHQFHRHCNNNDIRRDLALMRRVEQQQQKHINWLKPLDETQLETTIGFEHVAVDLTAWLAENEPDVYVKQALDFALLEDFDHLYRYANLLDMEQGLKADMMVRQYVEITPGRPTIAEHRHPFEEAKRFVDFKTADIRTKLSTMIITAGEQQTMNFYMNIGNTYSSDLGRKLYQEIAMIEEQHVSHYGALIDPTLTWLESQLLHEYMECYLYYSFLQDEQDANVKRVWEMSFEAEVAHLHKAAALLKQHERKEWQTLVPGAFPALLKFHDTKPYVRQVLRDQIEQTADREAYQNVHDLPENHTFFLYQQKVNGDGQQTPSHLVIGEHQKRFTEDYRWEMKPSEVQPLADRKCDNITIARTREMGHPGDLPHMPMPPAQVHTGKYTS